MQDINPRYYDVLIGLYIAKTYGRKIGRIQLQKYIYLADIISIIWDVIAPKAGHESYKHGPFDNNISNAVDVLAFRGFVDITDIRITDKKIIETAYQINDYGIQLFKSLVKDERFNKKIKLYKEIGIQIEKRDWKNLRALVYNDPTYLQSNINGWGYQFEYSNLLKNESLRVLFDFEKMLGKQKKISKENFITIFFKILEK